METSRNGFTNRPDHDIYFMMMALLVSSRSTCRRRAVGAVITDNFHRVVSTGYNGVPSTFQHCTDKPCAAAEADSGTMLDGCLAIHAEQNAVAHCIDIRTAHTIYVTTRPCMPCTKLLLTTPIKRIVFLEDYPHIDAQDLWISSGGTYEEVKDLPQLKSTPDVFAQLGLDLTRRFTEL